MDYARMLLPAATRKKDEDFTIDLAITDSNLTFGVQPYWNAGGWCNILDWGDGQSQAATTSGKQLTHTYAEAGSYRVKVRGDMYRFRVGSTNPGAVIDCNGNWEALGNITNGAQMFEFCSNAVFSAVRELPDTLISCQQMFRDCAAANFQLKSLPASLSDEAALSYSFGRCSNLTVDYDSIYANAPADGWASVSILNSCFSSCKSLDVVNVTIAKFLRKFPAATAVGNTFLGANNKISLFGTSDYFEIELTTTEANQVWGFTATSSAGRWYCFDWGDASANKGYGSFTSGTKVSHTFAAPGTYHIKLATAPCTIVFDPYDSDNGNWAALGQ